jgi:hypothetical protein
MNITAEECLAIAEECEDSAASVSIPALRATYLDLARQWRGLATCVGGFHVAGEKLLH